MTMMISTKLIFPSNCFLYKMWFFENCGLPQKPKILECLENLTHSYICKFNECFYLLVLLNVCVHENISEKVIDFFVLCLSVCRFIKNFSMKINNDYYEVFGFIALGKKSKLFKSIQSYKIHQKFFLVVLYVLLKVFIISFSNVSK